MAYFYYPGCSLKGTGASYEKSLLAVFAALDIPMQELPDWNCCGATSYMSIDEKVALAMAARNLAIAEENGRDIIAPCSACYMVLRKTQKYIKEYAHIRESILTALKQAGLTYRGDSVRIRHPLDVLITDVGVDEIRKRVRRPLNGVRVFPYYGCLIVRPKNGFDHATYPTSMDVLLEALGCEVIDHPLKTKCCGGSLTGTLEEVGMRLVYILLKEAKKRGSHAIATVCPLCQFNLDAYQEKVQKMYSESFAIPVMYVTQLLGYALGAQHTHLGLEQHIIPVQEVFEMVR